MFDYNELLFISFLQVDALLAKGVNVTIYNGQVGFLWSLIQQSLSFNKACWLVYVENNWIPCYVKKFYMKIWIPWMSQSHLLNTIGLYVIE